MVQGPTRGRVATHAWMRQPRRVDGRQREGGSEVPVGRMRIGDDVGVGREWEER